MYKIFTSYNKINLISKISIWNRKKYAKCYMNKLLTYISLKMCAMASKEKISCSKSVLESGVTFDLTSQISPT